MAKRESGPRSWVGTAAECADAIANFFANGRLEYHAGSEDPADVDAIVKMTPSIEHMQVKIPKHNARWSTFVKAILNLMATDRFEDPPTRQKEREAIAQEEATKVRNLCFHIRREWYRQSRHEWMRPFPRPPFAGAAELPGATAELPGTTAEAVVPTQVPTPAAAVPVNTVNTRSLSAAAGSTSRAAPSASAVRLASAFRFGDRFAIEPDSDSGSDESSCGLELSQQDDFHTLYSYNSGVDATGNPMAWRQRINDDNSVNEEKEVATTITEEDSVCFAHFHDGTMEPIPGMVPPSLQAEAALQSQQSGVSKQSKVCKRPAMATSEPSKRPRTNAGKAVESIVGKKGEKGAEWSDEKEEEDDDDDDDEEGEEESKGEGDEVIGGGGDEEGESEGGDNDNEAEEATLGVGGYAVIHGLELQPEHNGEAAKVVDLKDERYTIKLFKSNVLLRVRACKLRAQPIDELARFFNTAYEDKGKSLTVKCCRQVGKSPVCRVFQGKGRNHKQLGQIPTTVLDPMQAFDVADTIVKEMMNDTIPNTNVAFLSRREELVAAICGEGSSD
jgi:hypothetical protein